MIDERFVILGVLFNFAGSLSYAILVLKGKIKPNRVTWFFWALAPLIAFSAELDEGVGLQSLMTFAVGFGPLMTFIASFFNKQAEWRLTRFDYICGLLALLGLAFWYLTKAGNIAIVFSIFADTAAAVPTLKKAWKFPETESYWPFLLAILSATITLATIKTWDFAHFGFPAYIFLQCVTLYSLIRFKIGKSHLAT